MPVTMNDMIETAKKILSTEKHLNPIALLFTGDSIHTVPLSYKTDAEKEKYLFATGIVAKQLQTDHIYLIFDAAMRLMTPEAIKNYDVTESPLSFPESMRTECIIIHSLDMKTETRETAIIPYKNDGKEIEFLPDLPKADHLDTWMPGAVLKGYKL